MPFYIIRQDITKMNTDAIVNAANNHLLPGGGVCGAIFHAAGYEQLDKECRQIGYVATGDAVITNAYRLPVKFVIHTAGPVYRGGTQGEEELLYSCYEKSLKLAAKQGLESIAFPLISSGIYGYPKEEALQVATRAVTEFLKGHEMEIYLAVFDKSTFQVSRTLVEEIQAYIDDNYVDTHYVDRGYTRVLEDEETGALPQEYRWNRKLRSQPVKHQEEQMPVQSALSAPGAADFKDMSHLLDSLDESFSECLLRMIDEKGLTDVETYKKANIDRKLFSKIRGNTQYKPKKTTALAFAIALELNVDETNALLGKAGYILSHSSKFDVIVEYFIRIGNFNVIEINEALFAFDQMLLGS